MSKFLLHRTVKLVSMGDVLVEKPLIPARLEEKLPHCIIWDKKVFLLLERMTATYLESLPHLIND